MAEARRSMQPQNPESTHPLMLRNVKLQQQKTGLDHLISQSRPRGMHFLDHPRGFTRKAEVSATRFLPVISYGSRGLKALIP